LDHEGDAREAVRKSKKSSALIDDGLRVLSAKWSVRQPSLPSTKRGPPASYGSCLRINGSASAKVLVKLPTHHGYPHLCQIAIAVVVFIHPHQPI
jgi:hypothetical protein